MAVSGISVYYCLFSRCYGLGFELPFDSYNEDLFEDPGWDGSAIIVTQLQARRLGNLSRFPVVAETSLSTAARLGLGPKPVSCRMSTGGLFTTELRGHFVKLTTHPNVVQRLKNTWRYTSMTIFYAQHIAQV